MGKLKLYICFAGEPQNIEKNRQKMKLKEVISKIKEWVLESGSDNQTDTKLTQLKLVDAIFKHFTDTAKDQSCDDLIDFNKEYEILLNEDDFKRFEGGAFENTVASVMNRIEQFLNEELEKRLKKYPDFFYNRPEFCRFKFVGVGPTSGHTFELNRGEIKCSSEFSPHRMNVHRPDEEGITTRFDSGTDITKTIDLRHIVENPYVRSEGKNSYIGFFKNRIARPETDRKGSKALAKLQAQYGDFVRYGKEYEMITNKLYVTGKNDMKKHEAQSSVVRVNSDHISNPHLVIMYESGTFKILPKGKVKIAGKTLEQNKWENLPNNTTVLLDDIFQFKFLKE